MSEATILIVEDDDNLRLTLEDNLVDEGYRVLTAATVADARAAVASAGEVHVVILDIMLPDGDGYTLCRQWRDEGVASMVLMLTARTLEDDVVRGFDSGADDYLAKPYRLRELLARVRALARRRAVRPPSVDRLGGHLLDRPARILRDAAGAEVPLTPTEFDLLAYFLDHPGQALSRAAILDAVWGEDVVVDARTVDNFVSNLKRKLGWTAESDWRLATVRGVGYRLER